MTVPVIHYYDDPLNSSFDLVWYDKNSGAYSGVGIWRPRTSNRDASFFGDRATRGWTSSAGHPLWARVENDDPSRPAFAKPVDFRLIWQYYQERFPSKVNSIWEINPPSGYVALGSIATQSANPSDKPGTIPHLVCVRQDLTIFQELVPSFVWDDHGSHFSNSVGVWADPCLGHMFAVPNFDYPVMRAPYRVKLFPPTAGEDLAAGMAIPDRGQPLPPPAGLDADVTD